MLGLAAYIADDDPTARVHYERSLAIRRALRFPEGEGILVILLGLVAAREGNLVEARALYQEGLATIRELLGPWGLAMPLAALSHIAAANGQPGRAVRLGATATRLSDAYQTPLIPLIEPFLAQGLDAARQALGELTYARAWAEGQAMSLEAAIAEAFAVDIAPVDGRRRRQPIRRSPRCSATSRRPSSRCYGSLLAETRRRKSPLNWLSPSRPSIATSPTSMPSSARVTGPKLRQWP